MKIKELVKKIGMPIIIFSLMVLSFLIPHSPAYAISVPLENWNVTELNLTDDYVDVVIGLESGNTTLTVQWIGGIDDSPGAIGIDHFLYNCVNCGPFSTQHDDESDDTGAVIAVWLGSIGGTDVTSNWELNFNGTSGDGFGYFESRTNKEAGGTGGILQPLIFVLNGDTTFTTNNNTKPGDTKEPGTFATHVRYNNECSSWASDGNAGSSIESDTNCGAKVPEPSTFLLLGSGILSLGIIGRKFAKGRS